MLVIYSDGASRGNPGPAAIAVKILDDTGAVIERRSKFIGRKTNNEAEYEALILALRIAEALDQNDIICYLDSELVVKQLNGDYRVRSSKLEILWLKVRGLTKEFQQVSFNHVLRSNHHIAEVDEMANQILDAVLNK
jgi:ribonuclease HI